MLAHDFRIINSYGQPLNFKRKRRHELHFRSAANRICRLCVMFRLRFIDNGSTDCPHNGTSGGQSGPSVLHRIGLHLTSFDIPQNHQIKQHYYADDMQLYKALNDKDGDIQQKSFFEECLNEVNEWFTRTAWSLIRKNQKQSSSTHHNSTDSIQKL